MERFSTMSDGNINISDVLDAIETTDPSFAERNRAEMDIVTGGSCLETRSQIGQAARGVPYVEIVEQPASKALRFRYECEGRSAGSIPGVNSTPENKTFPSIRIVGYKGRAIVVVSCVTKDPPYRPHPHKLVGKGVCRQGVGTVEVSSDNMTVSFDKLGIQCAKRIDIEEALKLREEIRVDPFRTGFDHKRQPTSIDLNAVRLCFQVFLEGQEKGKFTLPLQPTVSEPIYDKKAMSDLVICKLSHCSASVAGGTEMVLLCEKVAKEDIQVRFFEEQDGHTYWEGFGDFQPTHVHKQVAIAFRTPSYKSQQVEHPVQAYIQLRRPSDGATSEPLHFQLLPLGLDDPDSLRRKRKKSNNSPNAYMLKHVQAEAEKQSGLLNPLPQYNFNLIKSEPSDRLSPFGGPSISSATSPTMFQVGNTNAGAGNFCTLRPIHSPERTPSPMECPLYNIPPVQSGLGCCSLQPIMIAQTSPSPMLVQDTMVGSLSIEPDVHYPLGDTNIISDAIGNAINIGNALDTTQQTSDFDLNFSQFDNVDLTNLNISDIVKEAVNGEEGASTIAEESCMTDSFTKLTRNTIQELCSLNNMYKTTRDDL
ncbi:PREDICTED: proto-oncogene c-Rel-like [Ceratosolen solmsi marchali]|uniref:Proto-oncogene c-Rel-like n=1 Tax=Ceratosolen solmsi marchali TaxID=326594 RepID=A0AAJ6YEK7_9HYME|nr:PREDICTED: proto-oncogene c-Rel-like [Ceratosolen solmsi marchali]